MFISNMSNTLTFRRYAVVIRKTVDDFVSKISAPLSHEDLVELEPKLVQIIENNIDKVSQDTVKTRHKAHMFQIRKKPVPIQQQVYDRTRMQNTFWKMCL